MPPLRPPILYRGLSDEVHSVVSTDGHEAGTRLERLPVGSDSPSKSGNFGICNSATMVFRLFYFEIMRLATCLSHPLAARRRSERIHGRKEHVGQHRDSAGSQPSRGLRGAPSARRLTAIEAIFDRDCLFSDPRGRHVGHRALEDAVVTLQAQFPDHVFSQIGNIDALQDSGRLAWAFGPPHEPRRIAGLDVAVVNAGRISALYTFLDATST